MNIHEAKTHLSRYVRRVEKGETILLCRHNRPIAEIRRVAERQTTSRVFGLDEGKMVLAPLDTETLEYFSGERA